MMHAWNWVTSASVRAKGISLRMPRRVENNHLYGFWWKSIRNWLPGRLILAPLASSMAMSVIPTIVQSCSLLHTVANHFFPPRSGSKKWAFQQLLRPVRQCHTRLHTSCMITFRPPNYKASFVGATISFLIMSCRLIIDTTWWNAKESPRSEHPFWLISTLYNVGVRPLLAPLFSPASLRKHCTGNQCHHQLHKHPYAWSRRRISTPRAPTFPVSSSPAAITNQPKPAKCLVSFSAP